MYLTQEIQHNKAVKKLLKKSCTSCTNCNNNRCAIYKRPVTEENKCLNHTGLGLSFKPMLSNFKLLQLKIAQESAKNKVYGIEKEN